MVRRHNGHCVNFLQPQELPEISKFLRRLPARAANNLNRPIGMTFVHIANGCDANIRVLKELLQSARPLSADADHSEDDLIVWALGGRECGPGKRDRAG